jgi:two-component system response regulator HydG
VARTLHYSGVATGAFLQLRCSALAPDSLEDELFGYVKGAFEGAIADRPGLLTLAQDGTLLLEEVADLPLESQRKLLEFFETRSVLRKGRDRREPVEVRVVASSSSDLESLAASGRILPALLAKFSTTIRIPPLRDRAEDIPLFATRFIDRFRGDRPITGIGQRALWVMQQYSWPGNLAELQDCIEQACRRTTGPQIEVDALSRAVRDLESELPDAGLIPAIRPAAPVPGESVPAAALMGRARQRTWDISDDDPVSLALYEKKALLRALDACGGDKLAAARLLRVGKSTLYRKLKRFDIH